MPAKLAACEPCRVSKAACSHERPVCSRCRENNRGTTCTYRARPFKRRHPSTPDEQHHAANLLRTEPPLTRVRTAARNYPNPGYLGTSSHATIFGYISATNGNTNMGMTNSVSEETGQGRLAIQACEAQILRGATILEQILVFPHILSCKILIDAWMAKGVNLALAGSLTKDCTNAVTELFHGGVLDTTQCSQSLSAQTCRPLAYNAATTIEQFSASFCHGHVRWETIGLFFAAVNRAATDLACFEPLYDTIEDQRNFRRLAMELSDRCLDISLSFDCLNDLQLILQYENFIIHSVVDGDQSYHSWSRLGAVISSLYALGYHEQIDHNAQAPKFLKNLRSAAFARTYSADKNVSIFLGRPPRIHRKYCKFDLPGHIMEANQANGNSALQCPFQWPASGSFDYLAETRWTAICAILKEETLEISRENDHDDQARKARKLQADAEAQWLALPAHFRLEGALRVCGRKAIEQDFMVSARLNHLHVLFLLRLVLVRRMTELDTQLIKISATILSLAVEALMLRDQLANSGTGLIVYYGLPAAGIMCVSLLEHSITTGGGELSSFKIVQDLSVLVAHVDTGALVHFEDPNYELLAGATRTIKSLLSRVLSGDLMRSPRQHEQDASSHSLPTCDELSYMPWAMQQDSRDFELDFWLNLAEHPALAGTLSGETLEPVW